MLRYILLAFFITLSGCISYKDVDTNSIYGLWEASEEANYLATYNFRKDGSGSYKYINHEKVCTMNYEFSWSIKGSRITIVGYHGLEIEGEYTEVMLHEELEAKYKQGLLTKLLSTNANRDFRKK